MGKLRALYIVFITDYWSLATDHCFTAFAIAATCSGVDPQHPPTTLAPSKTYFLAYAAMSAGVMS